MASATSFSGTDAAGFDPAREVMTLSEQIFRLVAIAQALIQSNRRVDVDGLQQHIGLLCAKALDLPTDQTGLARMELMRLSRGLDALHASMRERAA